MIDFMLEISCAQVAVFDTSLEMPFNNWTEAHFNQGFIWRNRSVSFLTTLRAGMAKIYVQEADDLELKNETVFAVAVPFHTKTGEIEIASVFKGEVIEVDPGDYELLFETGPAMPRPWVRFTFVKRKVTEARILKGRELIRPAEQLLMTAEPA